jgi:hypothetical protein
MRRFHFGATSGSLVDPPLLGPFQNVSPTLTRAMKPPHSLMVCDPFRAREVSNERHMRASRSQEANRVELEASGGESEVSHSRTDRKEARTQRGYCAGMKSMGFSTPVHQTGLPGILIFFCETDRDNGETGKLGKTKNRRTVPELHRATLNA